MEGRGRGKPKRRWKACVKAASKEKALPEGNKANKKMWKKKK